MADETKNGPQPSEEADLPEAGTPSDLTRKLADAERARDEYLAGWQRAKAEE